MTVRLLSLVFVAAAILSACDSGTTNNPPNNSSAVFNGETYTAIGNAQVRVTSDGLVVDNIGSSGNDGFRIDSSTPIQSGDFLVQEVALPSNGRWGGQAFGTVNGERTALATAWSESRDGEINDYNFDFAQAFDVQYLLFEYYLGGQMVYQLQVPNGSGFRSRAAPAGSGTRGPGSVHVIRNGGVLVVATDFSNEEDPLNRNGCVAALVEVNDPEEGPISICTDYVLATPIGEFQFPDAESIEVTGRSISSFTITDGSVE